MALTNAIQRIQDVLRKDAGVDGDAQRIGQLAWMLFLKAFDEHEVLLESNAIGYKSPIPPKLRWRNWTSQHQDVSGQNLIEFVNTELFPGLEALSQGVNSAQLLRSALSGVRNYMRSGDLLRKVIELIDSELCFADRREQHLIGNIYEKLLADLQSAGNAGEFYTPRAITDFIIDRIDPRPGERVLDFACGTGGFLTSTLEHWSNKYGVNPSDRGVSDGLLGVEKKALPHLLCRTNLLLHGVDRASAVVHGNMLDRHLDDYGDSDRVDVIVTNPPFGGLEEDGIQRRFPDGLQSKDTADLFMLLLVHLLRKGGRAAIVLPDGFLFGSGVRKRIRRRVLECCEIETVVRLPKGVFAPYTGISTNVLFLRRGKSTKSIWYFEHPYPDGQKSYSKTKPIQIEEFELEKDWWDARANSEHAWSVSLSDIAEREYRLDSRNPFAADRVWQSPTARIRSLDGVKESIASLRGQLQTFLKSTVQLPVRRKSLLLEHTALLTDAPESVGQLQDLLLHYAMTGRMSHRQGSLRQVEELASYLASLGADETLFDRDVDANSSHNVRMNMPRQWTEVPISSVAEVVGGGTPKSSDPKNFSEDGIPWLTPADLYELSGKYISRGRRCLTEQGLAASSAKLIPRGTVLFSSRAPIGYVAIAANPLATNQGFKSCVPVLAEMSEFIYYFLLSERLVIEMNAPGTTFREVSSRAMKRIRMPLPTLAEQRQIVEVLDEAFDLLTGIKSLLARRSVEATETIENVVGYARS